MLNQITPLILTYNEESNIRRTLEQLRWAKDIVVVDSFSSDQTLGIISTFPQVRVFQRPFDNFANQCNFGLTETGISTDWVLNLDADYVLTAELIDELRTLNQSDDVQGFRARFIYCVNGRRLRCGVYPRVTVLFRRGSCHFAEDGHAHRAVVSGRIDDLKSAILHDDRKPLSRWFDAQTRYAKLEAKKLLNSDPADLSWTDRIRRWRLVAPPAMLFYCLLIRGGILDGWPGFYYASQRTMAELMLSLNLMEAWLKPHRVENDQTISQPQINPDATDQKNEKVMGGITRVV